MTSFVGRIAFSRQVFGRPAAVVVHSCFLFVLFLNWPQRVKDTVVGTSFSYSMFQQLLLYLENLFSGIDPRGLADAVVKFLSTVLSWPVGTVRSSYWVSRIHSRLPRSTRIFYSSQHYLATDLWSLDQVDDTAGMCMCVCLCVWIISTLISQKNTREREREREKRTYLTNDSQIPLSWQLDCKMMSGISLLCWRI